MREAGKSDNGSQGSKGSLDGKDNQSASLYVPEHQRKKRGTKDIDSASGQEREAGEDREVPILCHTS